MVNLIITLLLLLLLGSCRRSDDRFSVDDFVVAPGFLIETVAAEPDVMAPVAMDFDERGRPWVLEMPGYMPNIDGLGEEQPVGRIVILEDRDGDGRADTSLVFLDSLVLARALALVYEGLLYAEPPNLWFVPIDNDRPGQRVLVDSAYIEGGNVEHQPNGLLLNIDNWIYSAKSGFRYRRLNGQWHKEPTYFRGQWGITHDDLGRLFYNDNSTLLQGDFLPPNILSANPAYQPVYGLGQRIVDSQRLYPLHATAVNRGYQDGTLTEDGKLINTTSACGPVIYRGTQFPEEFYGHAFVCAPEANLVKYIEIGEEQGRVMGRQAWEGREFLASTYEAFRPVNLYTGLDGALYVVDFHRGIIQHKTYMTPYLREEILERNLDTVLHQGRIYRIRAEGRSLEEAPYFPELPTRELISLLSHQNGRVRDMAQRLIIQRADRSILPELERLALNEKWPIGQVHALWTMEGLQALNPALLIELADSEHPQLSTTVAQLVLQMGAQLNPAQQSNLARLLLPPAAGQATPRWLLAHVLGRWSEERADTYFPLINQLLDQSPGDTILYEAILSGLSRREEAFARYLQNQAATDTTLVNWLLQADTIGALAQRRPIFHQGHPDEDEMTQGLELYTLHCSGCHGMDGRGHPQLAPPLYESEFVEGPADRLILLTLHGLEGPLTVNGKKYEFGTVMPGLAANPALNDTAITAILNFVRNGFGNVPRTVTPARVGELRRAAPPNGRLFTVESLEAWLGRNH